MKTIKRIMMIMLLSLTLFSCEKDLTNDTNLIEPIENSYINSDSSLVVYKENIHCMYIQGSQSINSYQNLKGGDGRWSMNSWSYIIVIDVIFNNGNRVTDTLYVDALHLNSINRTGRYIITSKIMNDFDSSYSATYYTNFNDPLFVSVPHKRYTIVYEQFMNDWNTIKQDFYKDYKVCYEMVRQPK